MPAEDLVKRYVDAVNRGSADDLASLYAPDAVVYDPLTPEPVKGRDAIMATFTAFKRAIPDMQWRLRGPVIGDDHRVAFEVDVSGVNTGPLQTPDGEVPPTHNPVAVSMALVETLDGDGRIAVERSYFDATGLASQLGIHG